MSILDIYIEALQNSTFLLTFNLMMIVMIAADSWAHSTTTFIAKQKRRSYWAETFLSQIHAVCVTILCCIQLYFDSEWSRKYYPYAASVSTAYFVFHGVKYVLLGMKFGKDQKMIYILHHALSLAAVLPMTNQDAFYLKDTGDVKCSDIAFFISASFHYVELSNIFMNIRIFAKLWSRPKIYLWSTIAMIIAYFPIRCVWLCYLIFKIFESKAELDGCFGSPAKYLLTATFGFVILMSAGYSVIMWNMGTKLFYLKHYKDC